MFGKSFPLMKLFGFQIKIDVSWFLVVILITWSLAQSFREAYPNLTALTYWIMGAAGAIGLFVSIILHELGHAIVARNCGLEMRGITLFIFGGVAEMSDEPPSPKDEFLIAIAGPVVSVVIGAVMLLIRLFAEPLHLPLPLQGVIAYLGWINLVLVAFNIIPAFPLDGGRVLRAALWQYKRDLRWATKITASIGSAFGLLLIVFGVFSLITTNVVGGIWLFILGLFLRNAARMSYQQVLVRRALEGEPVSRFMRTQLITVDADMPVTRFVEDIIFQHHHKLYPVVQQGQLVGCVTVADVKTLPRDQWDQKSVHQIMQQCTTENTISPRADAMHALAQLNRTSTSRLMVVENGRLLGVIALKDLLGFLSMKIDLDTQPSVLP